MMKIDNFRAYQKTISLIVIFIVQILFFYILPEFKSTWNLFDVFFEKQKNIHISIFSAINLPFGDFLYLIIIIMIAVLLKYKNRLYKKLNILLVFIIVFQMFFQVFWGIKYHAEPIYKTSESFFTNEEINIVTNDIIEKANQQRLKLSESEFNKSIEEIINEAEKSILYQHVNAEFPIFKNKIRKTSIKKSIYSPILNYLGILGYYNPFTAEAYINTEQPIVSLPFTISHEMAHQMGIAKESDASFVGYVYATKSNNLLLSYSAYLQAVSYLLYINKNEQSINELKEKIHPLVKKDLETKKNYFEKYNVAINDAFSLLNDWFLKSNREEGVISYSFVGYQIMKYELQKNNF